MSSRRWSRRCFGVLSGHSLYVGVVALSLLLTPIAAQAVLIRGIEYSNGAQSFADKVHSFIPGTNTNNIDPSLALGVPDSQFGTFFDVSLGTGGTLILEFTDYLLVAGVGFDLAVYETGSLREAVVVSLSNDGVNWITDATPRSQTTMTGSFWNPALIDINTYAGVNSGDTFRFVRLEDYTLDFDSTNFPCSPFCSYGADIDAVGAINSVVPEPSTSLLLGGGFLGVAASRRRRNGAVEVRELRVAIDPQGPGILG